MPTYNLQDFEIKHKRIFVKSFCTGLLIIISFIIYQTM